MNIDKIKEVVNNNAIPNEYKQELILSVVSESKDAIAHVLTMLRYERETKNNLIDKLNLLLSKAHTGLEEPKLNSDGFMQDEILEFYKEGHIGHCFKNIKK